MLLIFRIQTFVISVCVCVCMCPGSLIYSETFCSTQNNFNDDFKISIFTKCLDIKKKIVTVLSLNDDRENPSRRKSLYAYVKSIYM